MKYFTVAEMMRSDTAAKKGIDNKIPKEYLGNVLQLIEKVLDPLREAYGKPIVVTSGYRCPALNKAVGGSSTSDHCFDEETELLTTDGWKKYYDLSEGDTIFSYSIERDRIEIVPIDEIIIRQHEGKMMYIHNQQVDICVTDKHRMLIRYDNHKYKRKNGRNITPLGQKYFDSLKTNNEKYHIELADEIFKKRRWVMCANKYNGSITFDDKLDLLKLCIAVIADGFLHIREGRFHGIGFNLKKERKIIHTSDILNRLGIPFILKLRSDGAMTFWINSTNGKQIFELIGRDKNIPRWFWLLPSYQQHELLKEYAFYDGSVDKREGCNNFTISTTSAQNRDTIHGMCILSGLRCSYSTKSHSYYNINGKIGIGKEYYTIFVCECKNETRIGEKDYQWINYNGIVWCANNVNTTVIVRRNGKVTIQGNCKGCAADIHGTPNTKEENKRLFYLAQSIGIEWKQLIDEKNFSWVHISYKEGANRKQVLAM